MGSKNERHARSKSEWGTEPSRSAERAAVVAEEEREPARRAPARKDTRNWCKGKEGVPHVPGLVLRRIFPRDHDCEWRPKWTSSACPVVWACKHREACMRCGKVLREPWEIPARECPAYPGTEEQHAAAEAEAAEWLERREASLARWRHRKPPVTGPQGYRRRRAG